METLTGITMAAIEAHFLSFGYSASLKSLSANDSTGLTRKFINNLIKA